MEGDAVVSMRVNNFAGVMSKADAFGRKETAAAVVVARGLCLTKHLLTLEEDPRLRPLSCLLDQNQVVDENFLSLLISRTQHDFRSVCELNNHQQTCIRRTSISNTVRPKKKEHDTESSDEESE